MVFETNRSASGSGPVRGAHVILQDNGGTHLVDQRLVLPAFLFYARLEDGLMGQHRGEALVVIDYRYLRHCLFPAIHKLLYARQVLAGLAIGLHGLANDYALHLFACHIILQPLEEFGRSNRHQST